MTSALTISKLTFDAGPTPGGAGLELPPSTVTVLVGPNNSGKSLALREIELWCNGGSKRGKVIADIEITFPNDTDEAMRLLKVFEAQPAQGQSTERDHIWIGCHLQTKRTDSSFAVACHERSHCGQCKKQRPIEAEPSDRSLHGSP